MAPTANRDDPIKHNPEKRNRPTVGKNVLQCMLIICDALQQNREQVTVDSHKIILRESTDS